MAGVLVVCTGNVCRSPIAEGLLRASFEARMKRDVPEVTSAGTRGWTGSGADPNSIRVAMEHGIDISGHLARRLDPEEVARSTVIIGMAIEHVDTVVYEVPEVRSRAFTLKELVRLVEALPPVEREGRDPVHDRVEAAEDLRRRGFAGNPHDLEIPDPLGMPFEAFRGVAGELDAWCSRLADALVGRTHQGAATGSAGASP
jgi:low molecular weight protein-tyrosine phosphatase